MISVLDPTQAGRKARTPTAKWKMTKWKTAISETAKQAPSFDDHVLQCTAFYFCFVFLNNKVERVNLTIILYRGGGGGSTKLNPMVESHRPECHAKIFNCCVKGQSQRKCGEGGWGYDIIYSSCCGHAAMLVIGRQLDRFYVIILTDRRKRAGERSLSAKLGLGHIHVDGVVRAQVEKQRVYDEPHVLASQRPVSSHWADLVVMMMWGFMSSDVGLTY